jgi:hypothetical protein
VGWVELVQPGGNGERGEGAAGELTVLLGTDGAVGKLMVPPGEPMELPVGAMELGLVLGETNGAGAGAG